MKTRVQMFQVEGTGTFPFDMLRYDQCWPASEGDSASIGVEPVTSSRDTFTKPRTVCLKRHSGHTGDVPTAARWESFLWRVVPDSVRVAW